MYYRILKLQFLNSKFDFYYPFSVKIMLKTHQKPFGGRGSARTRWWSLSAPPDLLAAIRVATSKGRGGRGNEGRGDG